ncbi:MAG: ABC transporter permease [Aristaeellaceae bacterium]
MRDKTVAAADQAVMPRRKITWALLWEQRYLFLMAIPFLIWLVIFRYIPIAGWVTAFQNYKPAKGVAGSAWVGLQQFQILFQDPFFITVIRNTVVMGVLSVFGGFFFSVVLALLINEVRGTKIKRSVQTISYLPHFVSWVIVASLFSELLSLDGIVNELLMALGLLDEPVLYLSKGNMFWGIITMVDIWKETGWNSIIILAAITGIDPQLYESAVVDGAGRFKQMIHITLPGIKPVASTVLVMNIGWIISMGFERQYLMSNDMVRNYAYVIDMYALNYGIGMARYSLGTAIGVFKSVVSIVLLCSARMLVGKSGMDDTAL